MIKETIITLLPVMVGGIIALLGGIAGPLVSHFLASKKDRRRERIEKFEELFSLLGSHQQWMEKERLRMAFGRPIEISPSPLLRANAICSIYFPEMKRILVDLEYPSANYLAWAANAGERRTTGRITEMNEGLMESYTPYITKWTEAVDKFSEYAVQKGDKI
ncbi:hypothetical protein JQC79_19310 [Ochrobactrum anthropi]|uniref:hypothetical protein n=1 Tax=Brucella anthropi TaxID=529 RepID=UPI00194FD82B|nr:hypothetical protein [Brucella anthropi]MBM6397903.1 hypothetical protein [Brucella anthropi]